MKKKFFALSIAKISASDAREGRLKNFLINFPDKNVPVAIPPINIVSKELKARLSEPKMFLSRRIHVSS